MHGIALAELSEQASALEMRACTLGLQSALERRIHSHPSWDFVHICVLKDNYLLVKSITFTQAMEIVEILPGVDS